MYRPPQCSEREPDGTWEDCPWASTVMFANAMYAEARYPSTEAEYEALRRASGDSMTGGSNMDDVVAGMDARYHWHGTVYSNAPLAVQSLQIGEGCHLQGSMGYVSDHLRRWDPGFRGPHSVYVQREAAGYWWQNPLAPNSYPGELVTFSALMGFSSHQPGARAMKGRIGNRARRYHAFFAGGIAFWVYTDANGDGRLDPVRQSKKFGSSTGAPCGSPRVMGWYSAAGVLIGKKQVVKVTAGALAGKYVAFPQTAVRVEAVA